MALLGGGDYNTVRKCINAVLWGLLLSNLLGCGATTAFRLSHTGLGDSLLHAAQQLPEQELTRFLISWRNELRNELSTDKSGFLRRHFPSLANSVHNNFPDIRVIYQYVKPATSWSNGGDGLDTSAWLHLQPRLSDLAALCERAFSWSPAVINNSFRKNVWDGCCVRRLVQISKVRIIFILFLLT